MSFAADLHFNREAGVRLVRRLQALPITRLRIQAEREALTSKRAFIEFYNERGEPSPTGLLLTSAEWWIVTVNDSLIALEITRLRKLCYERFLQRVTWGGDHGAFAGVVVDLTRLASYMVEPIRDDDRTEVARLTRQILGSRPPQRPSEQECLWPETNGGADLP